MARWRDVKKGKITKDNKPKNLEDTKQIESSDVASALDRIKAFITDMFMIMMPIMYITTYIVMDGKDSFQASNQAHWITMAIYGAITISFWIFKGQTPGFKAYEIKLVNATTNEKLDFFQALLRYVAFLFSAATVLGALLPFFREDKKTLQDLLTNTKVIKVNE